MEKEKILEELGFSKSESIVYVALLKLGKTKSGEIIKTTGLQSSVVHNALNTLTEKGFASHIIIGKIKYYKALDPQTIEKYLESKKDLFKQILPELNLLKNKNKEIFNVEVYESFKGLYNATLKIIENAKKGDKYKYFSTSNTKLSEQTLNFFKKVDKIKKSKGIIVKGISNYKEQFPFKYAESKNKITKNKIPPAMNICNNFVMIFTLDDKPKAILIESQEIAKEYHDLWDEIWNNS